MPGQQNIRKHAAVGWRDLMDSDYYCCHGEDLSRCLVTQGKDGKRTHACVTLQTVCMSETTMRVCDVVLCIV